MDDVVVVIHILFAAVWIGGSVFLAFAGPQFRKIGGPAALGWLKVVLEAVPKLLAPAALLTGLSGVTIVLVQDEWDWGDPFVGIGITVVVVVLVIGLGMNTPNLRKALAALEAGDMPAAGAALQRVATAGMVVILLLIFAEYVMVTRLGA